jgi:hypothetical protein
MQSVRVLLTESLDPLARFVPPTPSTTTGMVLSAAPAAVVVLAVALTVF